MRKKLNVTATPFGPHASYGTFVMATYLKSIDLRFAPLGAAILAFCVSAAVVATADGTPTGWITTLIIAALLTGTGIHDLVQQRHAILRNYPIIGHLRFIFEDIRPEMRQYFFEADTDGTPFAREQRALVYQRAKRVSDKRPFGTQLDVYEPRYEWLQHSMAPSAPVREPFRIIIGGADCKQPYSASVFNISAMSYGALSANAILALNKGAALGGFAHDTGEGGISPYHRQNGGDLIWEIGSGYFGCRDAAGRFSPEMFAQAATQQQIKMIELKLSQGAKPGHGGVLPAAKITPEISGIRGVPMGQDCISPAQHSAFSSPAEMMRFIAELRRLSGGKPTGFKLCVGHPWEFMALVKAMIATGITPDFIVVDGKEGGTGAAPLEFMNHVGMPLRDGLVLVQNALVGSGLRSKIKIGASGKIASAFDMARVMALGADWCNSARGFMFAVGCIQAQTCHTGKCPTGVATQDPLRQRSIVVPDKAQRVANFHNETMHALAELIAAAGLAHPRELTAHHFMRRTGPETVQSFTELYNFLAPDELLHGAADPRYRMWWDMAHSDRFTAQPVALVSEP